MDDHADFDDRARVKEETSDAQAANERQTIASTTDAVTTSVAAAEPCKNRSGPTEETVDASVSPYGFHMPDLAERLAKALELRRTTAEVSADGAPGQLHRFWSSQPVPDYDETRVEADGPIDERPRNDPDSVPTTPYPLLAGFAWHELDVDSPTELDELYELLRFNYVEDDDAQFRFDYSRDFLRWALKPPGWRRMWHVGVRVTTSNKLVAFIAAVPVTMQVRDVQALATVEVNFLCIHKKLRHKRLAPVLIREITRRAHRQGIYQAVYTAGTLLPRPLVKCRYWHRSLDARKLIECGFSRLRPRMTLRRTERLYALPESLLHPDFVPMEREHCASARKLLKTYLERHTKFHPCFSLSEFEHWFLPREDVIYTFVRVCKDDAGPGRHQKRVTDMVSFYSLPSTVIHESKHQSLRAAYSFYNVATSCSFKELMHDALVLAKRAGFDVFNALHLMENRTIFEELKFAPGDGELYYYLYNWRTSVLECEENGLVML
ncbi:hypothetical protein CCYA_CCYA12G3340 [Cyanidiococcus yangmingshanensis]|nr:hypothetical protein CCYA_CCYA12G3340 [Cyanidiococcus yangmingshanensis]